MAVGIPGKGKRNKEVEDHTPAKQYFTLEYHGKKPLEQILSTDPGRYKASEPYCGQDNRLYHADNLPVLAALSRIRPLSEKLNWSTSIPRLLQPPPLSLESRSTHITTTLLAPLSLKPCANA